jgi:hypothetical protein
MAAQFRKKLSRGGAHQRGGRRWCLVQAPMRGGGSGYRGVDKWRQRKRRSCRVHESKGKAARGRGHRQCLYAEGERGNEGGPARHKI